ncbi:hypothetical protein Bca52824_056517 [Brassica carinata]|uniref:TLC domain-containing protein n=1 Tax=Brassica carinata TaxID=52824 RepID=A0A8X7UCV7_BRACI|nr:hypothetical protein Bca52824_056517 [Brassica carinata]
MSCPNSTKLLINQINFVCCVIPLFLASRAVFSISSGFSFSSANTAAQNTVLDFSVAYFLTDLLHYIVFYPSDVLFIGHHVATLFVFLTCRFLVSHGACAILGLLILAEVTSACQNAWTLAGARKSDPSLDWPSNVVRGVLGPLFFGKMVASYARGEANGVIPNWLWVSWAVVVGTAITTQSVREACVFHDALLPDSQDDARGKQVMTATFMLEDV